MNSRTVDHIMRVSVTGQTFLNILFLILDQQLFHLHKFVPVLGGSWQSRSEFILVQFVSNSELGSLCKGWVFALSEEVDPPYCRIAAVILGYLFLEGAVSEVVGIFVNLSTLYQPQFDVIIPPSIDDVLGGKNHPLQNQSQFWHHLTLQPLKFDTSLQNSEIVLLKKGTFKRIVQMLQNNLLFISIQLLLNFVLIQKETSNFEL